MDAISISGLKKSYPKVEALKGVDLAIPKGSFFGLLGPNGAGKTTLIHSIAGLTEPTSGTIKVHGHHNKDDYRTTRRLVGLCQQELVMDPFFSLNDLLMYQAMYFGISRAVAARRAEKLLKQFGIWDKKNATPREISGGQKRRVEIAKALMHDPKVLILDEPTAGLDVETRRDLWKEIKSLNERGLTILLTTHYIEEAQELCDTVAIINDGTIVSISEKTALLDKYARKTITARYNKKPRSVAGAKAIGNTLTIQITPDEDEGAVIRRLQQAGEIASIDTKRQTLEEVFIELTRKKQ